MKRIFNAIAELTKPPVGPVIMLNAKALSQLLTENVHPILYPKWFIITPAGTLIAYSTPAATPELRHQAALVSSTWRDHDTRLRAAPSQQDSAAKPPPSPAPVLQALTIETPTVTIIARAIQARLLLVLVAPLSVPEGLHQAKQRPEFDVHAEGPEDERYPKDGEMSVLGKQREKVDNGVVMIREELGRRGFDMPEGVD